MMTAQIASKPKHFNAYWFHIRCNPNTKEKRVTVIKCTFQLSVPKCIAISNNIVNVSRNVQSSVFNVQHAKLSQVIKNTQNHVNVWTTSRATGAHRC
jgi:hypothetical protein